MTSFVSQTKFRIKVKPLIFFIKHGPAAAARFCRRDVAARCRFHPKVNVAVTREERREYMDFPPAVPQGSSEFGNGSSVFLSHTFIGKLRFLWGI